MGDEHFQATLAAAIGKAVAAALGPALLELQAKIDEVDAHLAAFVPRRTITDSVKARHRAVLRELGGRCPCCGRTAVLDADGGVLQAGEWDHFYSRERREFADVWLVCRSCHRGMRNRHERTAEFESFQRRAAAIAHGQIGLFPSV